MAARTLDEVLPVLASAERMATRDSLHVAGFVAYEAAPAFDGALTTHAPGPLPLSWFAGFADATPVATPRSAATPPSLDWQPDLHAEDYGRILARIRALIGAGDAYQVNFTYRLRAAIGRAGLERLETAFAALVERQPNGLGAFIDTDDWAILCASHELFFERGPDQIVSRPMKGTVARGADHGEDRQRATWLGSSAKNRAENLMITDMVRNDLGRIAAPGTVRVVDLFALERHPTLWQMTSTVAAETQVGLTAVLRALFPAASITGAPKRRAMELVRELETSPRQVYTGSIGYLRPDGTAQFNVAIRTVLVDKIAGTAEYGIGGGIVWDSDADEEYAESRTKALILAPREQPFELLETLLWTPGHGYRHRALHIERLAAAAAYFDYPFDAARLAEALDAAAAGFPGQPRRVRVLMDPAGRPTVTHQDLAPLPDDYRVMLAPQALPVEHDPFVRHKTTRRAIYEQARRLAPEADDVLLWNRRGELTESTIANLLVQLDGEWFTPPVSSGLLPGVGRRALLEAGTVRERTIQVRDLTRCSAIALVNSLRGVWPVRLIESAAGAH